MKQNSPANKSSDSNTIDAANKVLDGKSHAGFFSRLLPFLGPAFIASIAYVDPGNFATNIQGGAKFGYTLLWVIVASNLMAILIQTLSAKLGIATGRNLAEHCRGQFPRWVSRLMWVIMEIMAVATDITGFIGATLGLYLLFTIPLWLAGVLTAIATFLIIGLERYGFRPLEAVITAFVSVISICYFIETLIDKPDVMQVLHFIFVPHLAGPQSIYMAAGILGATVMPHAIFLHSALTQKRIVVKKPRLLQRLLRFEILDVLIAMGIASLVNIAMLIMAASTFYYQGLVNLGSLQEAYLTLQPLLGPLAGVVFAISLLASGLSASSVGTITGQIIMKGFINREIQPWLRRLIMLVPSFIVILLGMDVTQTLVLCQVILSFGLPFAIIPLILFTSRSDLMGVLTNRRLTTLLAWVLAAVILLLNFVLIIQTVTGG
jgi:manganese transport protein